VCSRSQQPSARLHRSRRSALYSAHSRGPLRQQARTLGTTRDFFAETQHRFGAFGSVFQHVG
jgi:hypothetical protein